MAKYREVDHTADWAFHVSGGDAKELFRNAALAMYHMGGVKTAPSGGAKRQISLEAGDLEGLLVAWLNELIFLLESERIALLSLRIVELSGRKLNAEGRAAKVIGIGKYIKAATYGGLKITTTKGEYEATVVVDV